MDPAPPSVEPTPSEVPDAPPVAMWRKILWSLCVLVVVLPAFWAIAAWGTYQLLSIIPYDWRPDEDTLILLVSSLVSLLGAWPLLRSGLRRDLPARRGQLLGWGAGASVMAGLLVFAVVGFNKVRNSSRLKAMIPRQPAAAIDQFFMENPNRIFLRYDEMVGPDRYMRGYNPVDGEDLSVQFPIRQGWLQPLSVRLPDGTTVQRIEVIAAIGKSGLIITYPQPQDDQYRPARVYRLDCGVSFRDWRVVDLPPDPAGREGRDQDGVHICQLGDGRRYEITYGGGVPDGPFRAYHADGAPWGEATYRNGRVVEAWLITRDGRKFDELKDGEAAQKAVDESLAAASKGARDSGLQKLKAKDYAGALADLTRALAVNPLDAELHRARGDAYRATGNLDGAIEDYGAAEGFASVSLGEYRMPPHLRALVLARARQRNQAGDTAGAARDFDALGRDAGWAMQDMVRARDFAGAVRVLDEALEGTPTAELYAARAEARRGLPAQEQAAEADYTQALELARQGKMQLPVNQGVHSAHWRYKRGHVRRWLGDFTGAAEDFRAALPGLGTASTIQESDAGNWLFLAQCEAGQRDAALRELRATNRSEWWPVGQETARFLLGEITEAQLDASAAKSNQDGDRLKAELLPGLLRRLSGDEPGALERFRRAARLSSHEPIEMDTAKRETWQALRALGERALASGNFAAAAASLNEAVSIGRPAPAGLLALYGDARRGARDLTGALASYNESLRAVAPGTNDALAGELREKIAALNAELGPGRPAATAPRKAPNPEANQAMVLRNSGAAKLTRNDSAGALADLTRAIELQPNTADFHRLRGDARRQLGELDPALADYAEAMRLAPRTWSYPFRRGHLLRMKRDLAAAAQDFRLAFATVTNNSPQAATQAAFWLYFTECEQDRAGPAGAELERALVRLDQARPAGMTTTGFHDVERALGGLMLGQGTEEQLLARLEQVPTNTRESLRFRVYFFSAMVRRAAGDAPGALDRFRQALAVPRVSAQTYEFEIAEAKRAVAEAEPAGK